MRGSGEWVVFFSFLVNFLLLLGTNRLLMYPGFPLRCALAALFGGAWSGACLIPGFAFLGCWYWRLVGMGLTAFFAFGYSGGKRYPLFLLLKLSVEAVAAWMGKGDVVSLALGGLVMWSLCRYPMAEQRLIPLTLRYGGNTLRLTALRDTGNTLRDPVSGDPVLVIGPEAAMALTGLTRQQLDSPLETLRQRPIPGLRLIPYKAVGQGSGMLLGTRLEEVRSGGRRLRTVVAFAPEGLGTEEGYQALTGGAV